MVPLLNEEETAKMLGVSVACLRKWRRERRGPSYLKLGPHAGSPVRYHPDDLHQWVRQARVAIPAGRE